MRTWLLLMVCGACSADTVSPTTLPMADAALPDAASVTVPLGDCAQSVALYGMGGSEPTKVPLSLTPAGTTLCLALDGTDNIQVAHFAANMPYESGEASSFVMSLYDEGGVLIVNGWDVTFGTSPTTVFTNLERGMPKGQVTYAKLVVATRAGERTAEVALHLFEPYE